MVIDLRRRLTSERLLELMRELAHSAMGRRSYRIYLLGGGTAVLMGWRESTIDADLYTEKDEIFRDIQDIKERLQLNVEFVRPEDFVPALAGTADRHVFIQAEGKVSYYHYDPCAQLLSKVVRGFRQDMQDARNFLVSGMVDAEQFRLLVAEIPASAYARYPALTRHAVSSAVDAFLDQAGS